MEQLKYLEKKLETDISNIQRRSNKNRDKSSWIGISAIILGACITILLGLQIGSLQGIFKNIALICGVLVTVVNSIDRLFNFRTAWIKQTVTILKLQTLKSEIEFYKIGLQEHEAIDDNQVKRFFEQYKEIWNIIADEWSELRIPERQESENRQAIKA